MGWDEHYRTRTYPTDPEPPPTLWAYSDELPDNRALDMVVGSSRNASFLVANGYQVGALSQSDERLSTIDECARARGFTDRVETIRAGATTYEFPGSTYDLVTIDYSRTLDRLADIKTALRLGGVPFY